jgi:hypothetical protein
LPASRIDIFSTASSNIGIDTTFSEVSSKGFDFIYACIFKIGKAPQ